MLGNRERFPNIGVVGYGRRGGSRTLDAGGVGIDGVLFGI